MSQCAFCFLKRVSIPVLCKLHDLKSTPNCLIFLYSLTSFSLSPDTLPLPSHHFLSTTAMNFLWHGICLWNRIMVLIFDIAVNCKIIKKISSNEKHEEPFSYLHSLLSHNIVVWAKRSRSVGPVLRKNFYSVLFTISETSINLAQPCNASLSSQLNQHFINTHEGSNEKQEQKASLVGKNSCNNLFPILH